MKVVVVESIYIIQTRHNAQLGSAWLRSEMSQMKFFDNFA